MVNRKPIIGIVGGKGKMGRLLAKLFRRKGLQVKVSDLNTRLTNARLVPACDLVFFSLPLPQALKVIPRVAPLAKAGALLCDLTSVQEKTVSLLARHAPKSVGVTGVHLMFGPNIFSLKGQNIFMCPVRVNPWLVFLKRLLKSAGIRLHSISPRGHDRLMSVLHAGAYLDALSFARRMADGKLSLKRAHQLAAPNGRKLLAIVESALAENAWLLQSVFFGNRFVKTHWRSERAFQRSFKKLRDALL